MQRIDSLTVQTTRGTATLAYEGETGSKQWVWRFEDGTTETQPNVTAMMTYKRQVEVR